MAIGRRRSPGGTRRASFVGSPKDVQMDRKQIVRWALGLTAVGVAMMAMPSVAFAQEAAANAAEKGTFLTTHGAGWLGGAIGAGLAVMGGAAGQISTAMIITAAMIEGATLFGVVVGLMAVLKAL